MTVLDLERFLCQALAILPDLVRVECGDPARGCGADMGEHSDIFQNRIVTADRQADEQFRGLFKRLADHFAAWHFADAGMAGIIFDDGDVAREERSMRAAEIEQHAVLTRDWHHSHGYNARSGGKRATAIGPYDICRHSCLCNH